MKIVNVVPLKKGILKNDLTYFTTKDIESGSIVTIPIRNKNTLGLVLSVEDVADAKINIKDMGFNLKKIVEVKEHSVFLKEYIASVIAVSKYFVSNKSSAFVYLIPALFREEYDKIAHVKSGSLEQPPKDTTMRPQKLLLQESLENRISIYKTLIRENFALKKSVFIVLPSQNDVDTFREHLSRGIEQFTFSFHAGLSNKKIIEKFTAAVSVEHPVLIIGTAPFLSIPRPDMGVIILESESSAGYRMIARPHFDLRVFVEIFAAEMHAKFILSDNMLRFETIARRDIDGIVPMHPMSFRINFREDICIQKLVRDDYGFKILAPHTREKIQEALYYKKSVFIFALRKGLATQTVCGDCGEMVSCSKCTAPLVLYNSKKEDRRFFVCNRCGEEKPGLAVCSHCSSWNLVPLGIGTDTVVAEVEHVFPGVKVFKLDKEIAKSKRDAALIIKEFEENPGSILVGNQLAFYYLKSKVDLSIVASFDSFWSIPNFRMSEKITQLVFALIDKTKNQLIVQTKNDTDPAILAIQSRNLAAFIRLEIEDRKTLAYPPYKRFIKIRYMGNKADTIRAKEILSEVLKDYDPFIFSGFISQVQGKYVTNALLKIDPQEWSLPELSSGASIDEKLLGKLHTLTDPFEILVDPEDLL